MTSEDKVRRFTALLQEEGTADAETKILPVTKEPIEVCSIIVSSPRLDNPNAYLTSTNEDAHHHVRRDPHPGMEINRFKVYGADVCIVMQAWYDPSKANNVDTRLATIIVNTAHPLEFLIDTVHELSAALKEDVYSSIKNREASFDLPKHLVEYLPEDPADPSSLVTHITHLD